MAKLTKSKASRKKKSESYGIDDMVNAIHADLQADEEAPASAKEATKKAIKAVLQAEQALIVGAVADGNKVAYIGFGTYDSRARQERQGRNPQTGEDITIPATTVPGFKAGTSFKQAVKGE